MSILTRDLRPEEEAELERSVDRLYGICSRCRGPVEYWRRPTGLCARCAAEEMNTESRRLARLLEPESAR